MVIYQKQHRLAHRQYCVPLSESRLTRFPPPSKKAFFPSSHIFHVNSKCIIKTLFSSKCSSINFRDWLRLKGRDEETSAPERGTAKVAAPERSCGRRVRRVRGHRSPLPAWLCPQPVQPCQRAQSRAHSAASHPRSSLAGGQALAASPAPRLGEWSSNSYSHLTSLPRPRGLCYLQPCRAKQMMPRAVLMPPAFFTFIGHNRTRCRATAAAANIWMGHESPVLSNSSPNTNITSHKKSPGKASMGCDSINQN